MKFSVRSLFKCWSASILVPLCLVSGTVTGSPGIAAQDSTVYIIDKSELLTLRFCPLAKFNSLEVKTGNTRVNLQPNGSGSIGFGFNYRTFGLGIALGFPSSAESNELFGKTKKFDFQASYYGTRLAADGFFQRYTGYYLANPQDLTLWNETYYPQSPELKVFSFGGTVHYIFNSRTYSYRAAYLRIEIQKKSAGSFMAGIFAFSDEVHSPGGILPTVLDSTVRDDVDIEDFYSFSMGITGGYMYTLVIRGNFFINLGFTPGIGFRRFEVVGLDQQSHKTGAGTLLIQTRIAVGYEFRRFYIGANSATVVRNFNIHDYEINLGSGQLRLIVGTRFDVSGLRQSMFR